MYGLNSRGDQAHLHVAHKHDRRVWALVLIASDGRLPIGGAVALVAAPDAMSFRHLDGVWFDADLGKATASNLRGATAGVHEAAAFLGALMDGTDRQLHDLGLGDGFPGLGWIPPVSVPLCATGVDYSTEEGTHAGLQLLGLMRDAVKFCPHLLNYLTGNPLGESALSANEALRATATLVRSKL